MKKKEISEQAEAWMAVCSTLYEVMPGWCNYPGNGIESAVAAIRALAEQARVVGEPIGYLNPKVLNAEGKIDVKNALTWSPGPCVGWSMPIYASPPAPQEAQADTLETLRRARQYVLHASTSYYDGTDGAATRQSARSLLKRIDEALAAPVAQPATEQAEAPSDKQIAMAMLAVDDPMAWGKLGAEDGKAMIKQFVAALFATQPTGSNAGEQWPQPEFRKCEHCGCETNAKMRACCRAGWVDDKVASESRAALAIKPVAPPAREVQANNDVDLLLRQVFELCEETEGAPEVEPKNEHQRGYDKGRRFEAKSIRRAIGTWFQDEFCGRSFMGEPVLSATTPAPAPQDSQAVRDVLTERQRQVSVEGWTPEHDDAHEMGDLAEAAACYATAAKPDQPAPVTWPWDDDWWKPKDWRRNLVKAGALIIAEIERLDRAASGDEVKP